MNGVKKDLETISSVITDNSVHYYTVSINNYYP